MTLDASGNLGIPDAIGRLAYDNGDNSMRFTTNATERMRIGGQ
jgi:hypothetical protein